MELNTLLDDDKERVPEMLIGKVAELTESARDVGSETPFKNGALDPDVRRIHDDARSDVSKVMLTRRLGTAVPREAVGRGAGASVRSTS
jgi:hypothetical protein